jgi:hypothetical protein
MDVANWKTNMLRKYYHREPMYLPDLRTKTQAENAKEKPFWPRGQKGRARAQWRKSPKRRKRAV